MQQQQQKDVFEVSKEFISGALRTKELLKTKFNDDYQFDLVELLFDELKNVKTNMEMFEQQRVLHYVLIKSIMNCLVEQYNFKEDNPQLSYIEKVERTAFQNVYKKYVKLECINKNDTFFQTIVKLTVKRMDKLSIEWSETDSYVIMELIYLGKLIMEKIEKNAEYIKQVCECLREKSKLENDVQNIFSSAMQKNLDEDSKKSLNEFSRYFNNIKRAYKKKDYLDKLKNLKSRVSKIQTK